MKNKVIRIFRSPPELKTARLSLRKMKKSDARDMYEYASLEDVTKYLTWDVHPSESFTSRYLAYIKGRYAAGEFYDWAVVFARNEKMIGTCGFTSFDFENHSAEVGYVLNPLYWGHGIAAEALVAVMSYGFSEIGLHRIEAKYMLENLASRRVMEKVGMKFEGEHREAMYVKGKYISYGICSVLRDEFLNRNKDRNI